MYTRCATASIGRRNPTGCYIYIYKNFHKPVGELEVTVERVD
jgi:hypothetical protein